MQADSVRAIVVTTTQNVALKYGVSLMLDMAVFIVDKPALGNVASLEVFLMPLHTETVFVGRIAPTTASASLEFVIIRWRNPLA